MGGFDPNHAREGLRSGIGRCRTLQIGSAINCPTLVRRVISQHVAAHFSLRSPNVAPRGSATAIVRIMVEYRVCFPTTHRCTTVAIPKVLFAGGLSASHHLRAH